MLNFIIDPIRKLAAMAASFFLTYVVGFKKGHDRAEGDAVKKENKRLRSNVGVSDGDLAKRLRERAQRKDRNNR